MTKFDRPTLLTITAPTCSGKNYLLEALERELGFTRIVSTTTRPSRPGEIDGKDYFFISEDQSRQMELNGEFAELIQFRGIRYGVTHTEMNTKMLGNTVPMIILEPQGLIEYKKICFQNDWDVYSVYIATVEGMRISRLIERSIQELIGTNGDPLKIKNVIRTHTDRLLSITGDERRWSNTTTWDAIVPGDDVRTAIEYIKLGVSNRNRRRAVPTPYIHEV